MSSSEHAATIASMSASVAGRRTNPSGSGTVRIAEPYELAPDRTIDRAAAAYPGAVARPARVRFVTVLPKTRSGKLLRRAIQAVCEGRDPGDLTTIEDPTALQQIKDLVSS